MDRDNLKSLYKMRESSPQSQIDPQFKTELSGKLSEEKTSGSGERVWMSWIAPLLVVVIIVGGGSWYLGTRDGSDQVLDGSRAESSLVSTITFSSQESFEESLSFDILLPTEKAGADRFDFQSPDSKRSEEGYTTGWITFYSGTDLVYRVIALEDGAKEQYSIQAARSNVSDLGEIPLGDQKVAGSLVENEYLAVVAQDRDEAAPTGSKSYVSEESEYIKMILFHQSGVTYMVQDFSGLTQDQLLKIVESME